MGNICQKEIEPQDYNKSRQTTLLEQQEQTKKTSLDDFELLKVIGRGAFGKVMLVEKKSDKQLYALKIMKKNEIKKRNQVVHIFAEKQIMSAADNLFIVKLHNAFQSQDKLYLVMDFLNGGELFYHLKNQGKFSESKARFYIAEIILALEYLHNKGIIYRDLKPENVLLDQYGHLKLTDFGLSKEGLGQGQLTNTFVGTPEYLAPEIILNIGHDKRVDYWTVGALLYEMLTGAPPFYFKKRQQLYNAIVNQPPKMRNHFSPDACSLLQALLCADPNKRLGSRSVNEIKNHKFFQGVDWEKMAKKEVPPPFKPNIKNNRDLKYFDPMFTKETLKDTPASPCKIAQTVNAFNGFTYDPKLKAQKENTGSMVEDQNNEEAIQENQVDEEDDDEQHEDNYLNNNDEREDNQLIGGQK